MQQIGFAPDFVSENDTQLYGVAGFVLTGVELYRMLDGYKNNSILSQPRQSNGYHFDYVINLLLLPRF